MTAKQHRSSAAGIELLLLEDVYGLGRSGDVVRAKPGHVRNYLIPQAKAVVADKFTLRMQVKLQEERAKQAALDKSASEQLASQIHGLTLNTHVRVDSTGHMYGSVSVKDIVEILEREGLQIDRRYVRLPAPIKKTGLHNIKLMLKEEVPCVFKLKVIPEGMEDLPPEAAEVVAPVPVEEPVAEATEPESASDE